MKTRRLPKILARRERDDGRMMRVELLDLEFSNGEQRTYTRFRACGDHRDILSPTPQR